MWHTEQFCGIFLIIRNEWVDGLLRIASGKSQFSTNIGWTNRNASISYRRLVIQNETRPEFREQQPRQVLNIILSFIRENLVRNSIIATDVPNTRNVIRRISFNKKQKKKTKCNENNNAAHTEPYNNMHDNAKDVNFAIFSLYLFIYFAFVAQTKNSEKVAHSSKHTMLSHLKNMCSPKHSRRQLQNASSSSSFRIQYLFLHCGLAQYSSYNNEQRPFKQYSSTYFMGVHQIIIHWEIL